MDFDRDAKFNTDAAEFLCATGLSPQHTNIRSPWQNGIAEHCGRLLEPVARSWDPAIGDLRRLLREYVDYCQHDRIPDALAKGTPLHRGGKRKSIRKEKTISNSRLGGLHHRCGWREAA